MMRDDLWNISILQDLPTSADALLTLQQEILKNSGNIAYRSGNLFTVSCRLSWNIWSELTGTLPLNSFDIPHVGLQISISDKVILPFPQKMFPISGPDLQNSHVHSSRYWNISRFHDSHFSSQNVTFVTLTIWGLAFCLLKYDPLTLTLC